MIEDHKYIEGVRYTLYGTVTTEETAIICTERAREKGFKARRFKEREAGEDVYVIYVLRQG